MWLADLTFSDGWLQLLALAAIGALGGAITWFRSSQQRTNQTVSDNLAQTAQANTATAASVERIGAVLDEHARRLDRLERYQDTEHYADVIERRQFGGHSS